MGCTSIFLVALLGLALIFGGTWWLYAKFVNNFTASEPVVVSTETSDAQFASANDKLTGVREAARSHQTVTIEFTADDINALIARHPDFEDMRGKFRAAIADSIFTLEMSVPLRAINWPRIRDRWLNGTARFGLVYHEDNFAFALRSLTANGRDLPLSFMRSFATAFNDRFNESFNKSRRENERSNDFWENVKTVAVIDDKLVLTTKGAATETSPAAEDESEPTPTPATL